MAAAAFVEFVEFVLKHRQQVLGRLESAAAAVLPQA